MRIRKKKERRQKDDEKMTKKKEEEEEKEKGEDEDEDNNGDNTTKDTQTIDNSTDQRERERLSELTQSALQSTPCSMSACATLYDLLMRKMRKPEENTRKTKAEPEINNRGKSQSESIFLHEMILRPELKLDTIPEQRVSKRCLVHQFSSAHAHTHTLTHTHTHHSSSHTHRHAGTQTHHHTTHHTTPHHHTTHHTKPHQTTPNHTKPHHTTTTPTKPPPHHRRRTTRLTHCDIPATNAVQWLQGSLFRPLPSAQGSSKRENRRADSTFTPLVASNQSTSPCPSSHVPPPTAYFALAP